LNQIRVVPVRVYSVVQPTTEDNFAARPITEVEDTLVRGQE